MAAYLAGSLDRLISTIITTIIAISVVFGIWLVGNAVLTQARKRWPVYMGLSWGILAAAVFGVMRGTRVITALFVEEPKLEIDGTFYPFMAGSGVLGHIEWSLVGAAIWGGGAFAMAMLPSRILRIPVGLAMGIVTGLLIAPRTLILQRPAISWGATIVWMAVFAAIGVALTYRQNLLDLLPNDDEYTPQRPSRDPVPGIILGAFLGWIFAVWLRAGFGGFDAPYIAAIVPAALLGLRLAWKGRPTSSQIATLEERGRAVMFLGPAVLFLSAALVIPAIGTIRLSFLDRDGRESVGWDNYREYFAREDAFDVSNWSNLFGSQLFWLSIVLVAAGALIGTFVGTSRNGHLAFDGSGASIGGIAVGAFIFLTAVFSVLRGTFFNNLWWIVTVTVMSVVLGLTVAVLSEQAGKFESVAKSLIFMPLAVSFVGASIIWRLQYQARPIQRSQTGLLNWVWLRLGELSHSSWPRWLVLAILAAVVIRIVLGAYQRATEGDSFTAHVVGILILLYLLFQLLGRSLGGFTTNGSGDIVGETVLFIENRPFNNVFLMIVLIWLQTGFAMVILSAAIKAVPGEYIEAAKVDGASESQTFFNIVLPTILPTVGVITTTLIVLVTKVFDIVKVTTNGNFGTNVLANDFFTVRFNFFNNGLGSAIATILLLMVLPVMILNVRRMQQTRNV